MLKLKVDDNYLSFTQRRLANPYNKNVNETVFFGSCGDEFFRDEYKNERLAYKANQNFEMLDSLRFSNQEYYLNVTSFPYHDNIAGIFQKNTEESGDITCVVYTACRVMDIPLLYAEIETFEGFSNYYDLHAMYYNEQLETSHFSYIWCICFWLEVNSKTLNK
ncbi:hypothetical protein [Fulvivirga sediminis]|uniref:Uncharacterized protein n=1 Tax=Fulvivirga sediminis TaxID=2803949 RepID=A0A937K1X1_9BACT|nr:hypothetical protein [Fulvivirga sediminis]MBL3659019.1 hypothetical protein [Fulvivirga sediminis]